MLSNIFALTSTAATEAANGIGTFELIVGILIMVVAVALVFCVLMQSSKDKSLSGTISGAGETFFSKSKAGDRDKLFSKITFALSIVFAILVVVMYLYVS